MKTSVDVAVSADVERPAREVWALVSDATRLPEWLGQFEEVVQESGGPVGKETVPRTRSSSPGTGSHEQDPSAGVPRSGANGPPESNWKTPNECQDHSLGPAD